MHSLWYYFRLYHTHTTHTDAVIKGNTVHILDLAAKLDSTAEFLCKAQWGDLTFPPPFGREALPEVSEVVKFHSQQWLPQLGVLVTWH